MHFLTHIITSFLFSQYTRAESTALDKFLSVDEQRQLRDKLFMYTIESGAHHEARRFLRRKSDSCNPEQYDLVDYPQWEAETGYWVGELSFYGSDGSPFESSSWNYPYDSYTGFITGNVQGSAYRQRNVFLYPPQTAEKCTDTVVGEGECGSNGNTKVFFADQRVTTCPEYPNEEGDIEGPYLELFYTKTELVGRDNALLYQVYLTKDALAPGFPQQDCLVQSQLTTISNTDNGDVIRVRNAQGFQCFDFQNGTNGTPISASYYRERRVDETFFYEELERKIDEYNILSSDLCAYDSSGSPSPYSDNPGLEACKEHLNQSFELI